MSSVSKDNFYVLVNEQNQYSIWPERRPIPEGWREIGGVRPKGDCLEYIENNWKDMRPLGLQTSMASAHERSDDEASVIKYNRSYLPQRLSNGDQEVEIKVMNGDFRSAIESGTLRLRFPNTDGGSNVVIKVAAKLEDLEIIYHSGSRYALEGEFSLDGVLCKCFASLDLKTLKGSARVDII